jgi:prepilin-type N-terminal cleavage/methylation domain-containing protein
MTEALLAIANHGVSGHRARSLPRRNTRRPSGRSTRRPNGFSLLEALVVVAIVSTVVGIGVPTLHARARLAVLDSNERNLAALVEGEIVSGFNFGYQPSGSTSPDSSLSTHLESLLRDATGKARYVNPIAARATAYVVVNSHELPVGPSLTPPAVYITDNPDCRFEVFNSLSQQYRLHLAGALLIFFNSGTNMVDIFYVDSGGLRSPRMVSLPAA